MTHSSGENLRAAGYHGWHDLLFIHWRVPPRQIESFIPAGLTLDTRDGDAWIGIVAFWMSGIRPWWFFPLPMISTFPETNLRTYVTCQGKPGVYFFSLDAACWIATKVARWKWGLPYHWAKMQVREEHGRLTYESRRYFGEPARIRITAKVALAETGGLVESPGFVSTPGSLEEFLCERYYMFIPDRDGVIRCGEVIHEPYRLHPVQLERIQQELTKGYGIAPDELPCHAVFSRFVSATICPLRPMVSPVSVALNQA